MWQFPARTLSVKVGGSWRHLLTKKKTYQTSECYRSGWCVILLLYSYFLCSLARHLSVTLHAKIPLSQNDAAAVWTKLTPTRPLLQPFTQSPPSEIQVSCLGRFLWGEGDECGMCVFWGRWNISKVKECDLLTLRFPVLATQLHPQHKRLLSQRPQGFRR